MMKIKKTVEGVSRIRVSDCVYVVQMHEDDSQPLNSIGVYSSMELANKCIELSYKQKLENLKKSKCKITKKKLDKSNPWHTAVIESDDGHFELDVIEIGVSDEARSLCEAFLCFG